MVSPISPPGLSRSSNAAAGRASDGAPGSSSSRYRPEDAEDDDDVDIRIPEAFAVEDDPATASGGGGSDSSAEDGATALKGDVVHAATAVQTKTYCGVTLPSSNWKILGAVFGAVLILVAIIVGCLSAAGKLGGAGTDTGTVAESSSAGNLVCPASKLIASDVTTEEDRFGYSVALSSNVAVVGAYWSDSTKVTSNSGAAYVFELVSDPNSLDGRLAWVETAKLTIDEPEIDDKFGVEVAVGMGGTMLIIAADAKDEKTGSVYIFERAAAAAAATSAVAGNSTNNGTFASWTMSATLRPDDVVPGDNFGDSVAMDGTTLVVTAGNRPTGGLAYVYTFTDENKWEIQAQLQPDVPTNEKDKFGGSVAISGDTIVIGAMKTDDRTGAAYVYVRSGNSWTQQAMLFAEDGGYLYEFGNVVDIDRAGETIVVGSWKTPNKDIEEVGSVYVFTRQGSTWVQQAQITPSDAIVEKRRFGTNVVINADGNMMLISDYFNNERRGSVYQYSLSGDTWELEKILHPPGLEPGDHYGFSMAMHESSTGKANALIGEYGDSDVAFSSGAAWHIELCDSTR